jgi:hypothetical protein
LSRNGIPQKSIREYVDGKRRQGVGPTKAAVEDKAADYPQVIYSGCSGVFLNLELLVKSTVFSGPAHIKT